MTKQFILALFGYCILLSSIVAQNSDAQPAISIDLPKMNVLYAGVDNPIMISHEGLSSSEYQVQVDKGTLMALGAGHFNLNVNSPGEVVMTVTTPIRKHFFHFKAMRIPDPMPALGTKYTRSDTMDAGAFKAQMGVTLILQNFDFDVMCGMVGYKITHIGSNHVTGAMFTHTIKNAGPRFSPQASKLISEGVPGDIFIFSDIKGRCPGDVESRNLGALVFFLGDKE